MREIKHQTELCVVGGGLSGLCCALAAARHGVKTILVQDRPVLGGNSSSEIRMWVCGAHGDGNRESGIVEELMLENYYSNPGEKFALWDAVLYDKAIREKNLTLLLNTSVFEGSMEEGAVTLGERAYRRIRSVRAWQGIAETFHTIEADYFADCSGDSILAPLTGASFRMGREGREEFGEPIAPMAADRKTMGMSCLFQIRERDHPVSFTPPSWAYRYTSKEELPFKDATLDNNFWWIEVGGEWDAIHDADRAREECLKISYGVFDYLKNYSDEPSENWELEWIGFLPGKRESRRYVGEVTVTEHDVEAGGPFEDLVAYGGWSMDDHFPEGFYYTKGYPTIFHPAPSPWGLPLRCMISKDIQNLVFAGRNISVTHTALSSSRVMATCAVLGQALGTAIYRAFAEKTDIRQIDIKALQQILMEDDCYLPGHVRCPSPLSQRGRLSHPRALDGMDRNLPDAVEHGAVLALGESISYVFKKEERIRKIVVTFDSDLDRPYDNMPCYYPLEKKYYQVPESLVKAFEITAVNAAGETQKLRIENNRSRLVRLRVDWCAKSVALTPLETFGAGKARVFRFELF